jgi:hypothetical protein
MARPSLRPGLLRPNEPRSSPVPGVCSLCSQLFRRARVWATPPPLRANERTKRQTSGWATASASERTKFARPGKALLAWLAGFVATPPGSPRTSFVRSQWLPGTRGRGFVRSQRRAWASASCFSQNYFFRNRSDKILGDGWSGRDSSSLVALFFMPAMPAEFATAVVHDGGWGGLAPWHPGVLPRQTPLAVAKSRTRKLGRKNFQETVGSGGLRWPCQCFCLYRSPVARSHRSRQRPGEALSPQPQDRIQDPASLWMPRPLLKMLSKLRETSLQQSVVESKGAGFSVIHGVSQSYHG